MEIITISLKCDSCGCQSPEENAEDNVEAVRKMNLDIGWVYKPVENGSNWDFCPDCMCDLEEGFQI